MMMPRNYKHQEKERPTPNSGGR
uniref:Uncharacterized protein n=1 Tax=Anguilla anguilla TaxID=7936 RepID=A0A0E9S594_ANGAN